MNNKNNYQKVTCVKWKYHNNKKILKKKKIQKKNTIEFKFQRY